MVGWMDAHTDVLGRVEAKRGSDWDWSKRPLVQVMEPCVFEATESSGLMCRTWITVRHQRWKARYAVGAFGTTG